MFVNKKKNRILICLFVRDIWADFKGTFAVRQFQLQGEAKANYLYFGNSKVNLLLIIYTQAKSQETASIRYM